MKTSVNKYVFNIILLTLILFCNGTSFSNELKTDSLNNMLSKNLNSQTKIKVLLELGYLNSVSNNNNKALSNINEVFRLSIKSGKFYGDSIFSRLKKIVEIKLKNADSVSIKYIDIGIKEALNFKRLDFKWSFLLKKGSFLRIIGKSDASIKLFNELLLEIPKNDSVYKPFIYNNLAQSYIIKSDYQNALKYLLYARKLFSKVGNTKEEFACVNNIGGMYFMIEEYEKSIPFLIESLDYSKSIKDSLGICESYMNIGLVYTKLQKTDLAIINQTNAENILQYLNSPVTRAGNLCNLGMSFHQNKEYQKSEEVFLKAIKILEATSDLDFLSITYQSLGTLYLEQKNWQKARYYLKKSEQLVNKIGNIRTQMVLLNELFKLEKGTNNFIMALEYLEKYSALKDSIFNSDKMKELSDINTKNAIEINEEKSKAIQLKKDILTQAEIRRQKQQRNGFIIGLVFMMSITLFIFRSYRQKQRSNIIITKQKEQVEQQKNIVEYQNKEILSSIEYAKRIQATILPPPKVVKKYLDDSFVFYLPKDIVAGDFYWMETVQLGNVPMEQNANESKKRLENETNQLIMFAACDCTGHGVPGALVSVVCSNALNRAVKEYNLTQPSLILDKVAELVVKDFSKDESEDVQDGMDASLCALNIETGQLQWAGANNALWIIRNGLLLETKADKQPIGKTDNLHPFVNHEIQLEKGDTLYLFTDGYADQFGGEKEKKYSKKSFKELIISINYLSMLEQRETLYNTHINWRGANDQVDDICIIGVRI
jgi:serine phosphatase RsbU (regulator of sigma subunit)